MAEGTFTVQDYQTAAFGDQFRSILDMADMLKNVDLDLLLEIVGKIKALTAAEDMTAKVKIGISLLRAFSQMTETKIDDNLVGMLDSVLTEGVLDVIARIISGLTGFSIKEANMLAADQNTAEAAGIPWFFLHKIALLLFELIEKYTKK